MGAQLVELDPDQQTGAADLDDVVRRRATELGAEQFAHRERVREQAITFDRVDHRERRGARDGPAAERGCVIAGGERDVIARDAGADRQAAPERLGERRDVRNDAGRLDREPVAAATAPRLHLIGHKERVVVVAQRPRAS